MKTNELDRLRDDLDKLRANFRAQASTSIEQTALSLLDAARDVLLIARYGSPARIDDDAYFRQQVFASERRAYRSDVDGCS